MTRTTSIAALLVLAIAAAGCSGCKKKKPAEPEAVYEPSPAAGNQRGPKRSEHPVSVGTPPGGAATPTPPPAPTPSPTPSPGSEPATAAAPGAAAPSGPQPGKLGYIPPSEAKEAAAKAPPELVERGEATIGTPEVGDARKAEDTAALLARVRTPIAGCQTRVMRDNPGLAGTTTFDLTVDPRGVVSSYTVEGSLNDELTTCVANRLRGLRFGATEAETHIRVPIRFGAP